MTETLVPAGSALTRALHCATTAPRNYEQPKHINAEERLKMLESAQADLLPVDDHTEIEKEIRTCQETISTQKGAARIEEIGSHGYQILSTDPFTWRSEDGMPLLAPFSLTSNTCRITETDLPKPFPECVKKFYEDVSRKLRVPKSWMFWAWCTFGTISVPTLAWIIFKPLNQTDMSDKIAGALGCIVIGAIAGLISTVMSAMSVGDNMKIRAIEASFAGIVPAKVKKEIETAKGLKFFQEIFLLAETPHWDVKLLEPVRIPRKDPLVVGYDGQKFWLITAFDMTSLEQHIADNYAVTTE